MRYYLDPLIEDETGTYPKSMGLPGVAYGYPSPSRGYYIIAVEGDDFTEIDSQAGTVRIWRESYPAMAALGVDVTGLTAESTDTEIGARVLAWLQVYVDMRVHGVA